MVLAKTTLLIFPEDIQYIFNEFSSAPLLDSVPSESDAGQIQVLQVLYLGDELRKQAGGGAISIGRDVMQIMSVLNEQVTIECSVCQRIF